MNDWFRLRQAEDIPSPALLVFTERVAANLAEMVRIAGDPTRLRPHLKTHKLPELTRQQLALGIAKFKCATVAEAEMAAVAGAREVLLAYQPVGPQVGRLLTLAARHATTRFACLVDNPASLETLAKAAQRHAVPLEVLVDLDIGQHRTGLPPDARAASLYRDLCAAPALTPGGLHAYDGHLHETDVAARTAACEAAFAPVAALRSALEAEGLPVPRIVAGGSPTFRIHARREGVELSPGTTVLWDAGYARKLPDLPFLPAAVLLTRVISKPLPNRLCLDLGHKAVGSEMPWPRVEFLNLPDATFVAHSEEHLVLEAPSAEAFEIGHVVYALPWHVCPTVALHDHVYAVADGTLAARWSVAARSRRLTV